MSVEQNPLENLKMENPELNKEIEEDNKNFQDIILPQVEEKMLKRFNEAEKAEARKIFNELKKVKGGIKDPVGYIVQELENRDMFKQAA